ncbi:ubiquitin-conjugating enzyme E2 T-like, partial [Clytia hemisphaerica]
IKYCISTFIVLGIIILEESPYEKGVFQLDIKLTERYPFEPPSVKFITPIYHPNVDTAGRICLDLLKMPPKGSWKPSLNLSSLLQSIQLLVTNPNPDDPLMADIAQEFLTNKRLFNENAKSWTEKHALQNEIKKPSLTSNENKRKHDIEKEGDSSEIDSKRILQTINNENAR